MIARRRAAQPKLRRRLLDSSFAMDGDEPSYGPVRVTARELSPSGDDEILWRAEAALARLYP
jgi:hypothetical protein